MASMVRAGGIGGYLALMRSLNVDPEPCLRRSALTVKDLEDDDALIPLDAASLLLESSAKHAGCPDLALRLAQVQDINILGPIAPAIQNCQTLELAMQCISEYLFIQSPGIAVEILPTRPGEPGDTRLLYRVDSEQSPAPKQIFEHGLAIAHRIILLLKGGRYQIRGVGLAHEPDAGLANLARFFGIRVQSGQPDCNLFLDSELLETPLPKANPILKKMAEDFLNTHYASPDQSLSARVRKIVQHRLGSQTISKTIVATQLAMHPRTLQRQLKDEGTSYNEIRDDIRRDAAKRYLASDHLTLTQVASLLGFEEQSALTRFCRQRLSSTPSELRKIARHRYSAA